MSDVFCKIIAGEIPAERIAESADWIAIHDIHPQAPTHVLIVPKKHIAAITDMQEEDTALVGRLMLGVKTVADTLGLTDGFRVIINHGEHGGQTVPHLHVHVLGGKSLGPKIVHE